MDRIGLVAPLGVLTFLWTLSRAVSDAVGESNTTTTSPFTTLNATLSDAPDNSTSVGAIVGRVAVALGVAGAVGVLVYLVKKRCPRGSADGEHPPGIELQRVNREASPLNNEVESNTNRPSSSRDSSSDLGGALQS